MDGQTIYTLDSSLSFGKHRGMLLSKLILTEPYYAKWLWTEDVLNMDTVLENTIMNQSHLLHLKNKENYAKKTAHYTKGFDWDECGSEWGSVNGY